MTISILQALDGGIDSAQNSTNRTKAYTSNITAGSVLVACFSTRDNSPGNLTVSDNRGNTWISLGLTYDSNGGRGCMAYYAVANGASIGTIPTVTFNKNGSNCGLACSVYEFAGVQADVLDTAAVSNSGINTSGPATATLGATSYTNDLVVAVLALPPSSYVVATPLTNYTDLIANSDGTISLQHKVLTRQTTVTGVYSPGWSLSLATNWNVVAFVLKGSTTAPTLSSISSTTPANGSSVTVTGVNLGASQGTISLGGFNQTVTAWSATSITFTVNRVTSKYGVPLDLIATTSASIPSNTCTLITAILPQSGWSYINLGTPNGTSTNRITAVADLVSGDQLAYDNLSGTVAVYSDATFSVGGSVTAFSVEAWFTGNGWGSTSSQSFGAAVAAISSVRGLAKASITSINGVSISGVYSVNGLLL